jgi:hypothetical protein
MCGEPHIWADPKAPPDAQCSPWNDANRLAFTLRQTSAQRCTRQGSEVSEQVDSGHVVWIYASSVSGTLASTLRTEACHPCSTRVRTSIGLTRLRGHIASRYLVLVSCEGGEDFFFLAPRDFDEVKGAP